MLAAYHNSAFALFEPVASIFVYVLDWLSVIEVTHATVLPDIPTTIKFPVVVFPSTVPRAAVLELPLPTV